MILRRHFSFFITFVLVVSLTIIVPLSAHSQPTTNSCQERNDVCLDHQYLFTIKASLESKTPENRAAEINNKIKSIANNNSIQIDSLKIEEEEGVSNIILDDEIIVTVTDDDSIAAAQFYRKVLAEQWLQKIQKNIKIYRKRQHLYFTPNHIKNILFFLISPILIAVIFLMLLLVLYCVATFTYYYCLEDNLTVAQINKDVKYFIRKEVRRRQQEKWINHLNNSRLQLYKITNRVWNIVVSMFGRGLKLLVSLTNIILIIRLFIVIYNTNFYLTTDDLEKLRTHIVTLLNILGLLFIFGVLSILLNWLSRSGGGTVVLPFDGTTASTSEAPNNNSRQTPNLGKAIADSLVEELHRIRHIHTSLTKTIKTGEENIELQRLGRFNFPRLTSIQENIESNLTDVVTFEAGKTSFDVGRIILTLKWLWSFGGVNRVISGSLQTYDSITRLVVRLDYQNEVKAWEVTWENHQKEPMTEKIKDLAYKVV
jgi:hypothetical protein